MFGISFKRLLLSGCGAGGAMTFSRLAMGDLSVIILFITFFLLLYLTAPAGGLPRWKHLHLRLLWLLKTASRLAPGGVWAQVATLLQMPTLELVVDGDSLFAPIAEEAPHTALTDWVSYTTPDAEEGLVFHSDPLVLLEVHS